MTVRRTEPVFADRTWMTFADHARFAAGDVTTSEPEPV
jgi:hypothetical protein